MVTLDAPVLASAVPEALVLMTLSTQVVRAVRMGFGNSSGGPKKQLALGKQPFTVPPQLASCVHAGSASVLMHTLPGPAAFVQSSEPVPLLATRFVPLTSR